MAQIVDGEAVGVLADAAANAGTDRFVLVSAFPDAWRDQGMSSEFEQYMKIKKQADVALATTDLDWVILRPGTLTNRHETGSVTLGPAVPYRDIPRADLAAVLAELVHRPAISREVLEVTEGTIPVAQAVARLERR